MANFEQIELANELDNIDKQIEFRRQINRDVTDLEAIREVKRTEIASLTQGGGGDPTTPLPLQHEDYLQAHLPL